MLDISLVLARFSGRHVVLGAATLSSLISLLGCARTVSTSDLAASAEAKDFVAAYHDLEALPDFQAVLKQYQRFGADLSNDAIPATLTIKGKTYQGFNKMVDISSKGLDIKTVLAGKSYQEHLASRGMLTSKLNPGDIDSLVAMMKGFVDIGGDLKGHPELLAKFSSDETMRAVNTAMVLEAVQKVAKSQPSGLRLAGDSQGNAYFLAAEATTALAKLLVGGVTTSIQNIDTAKSIEAKAKLMNLCTDSRNQVNKEITRLLNCQNKMPPANTCNQDTTLDMNNGAPECRDVLFKCVCQETMEPGKKNCLWKKSDEVASSTPAPQVKSAGTCNKL